MDNPDKDYDTWEVLPGRREKLARLISQGNKVAIVTDQGGVAFGFVDEQHAWIKIYEAARQCGLRPDETRTYACFHDTRGKEPYNDPVQAARRKPSGKMITEAMYDAAIFDPTQVLFVGDRDEDREAARSAGVSFQWAHIFLDFRCSCTPPSLRSGSSPR